MAKLFKLALESSDLEGAVASQEPAQPALDEAELEQNVEETTQEQAEIEQGEEEIDQALEEANGLVEQIEANDEKLENPDAVVTAADVEVSEEALKRACYSLGIPFQAKLSFASESVVNDIRANARKYLATSNEELKDNLYKILIAIKKMCEAIFNKIKLYTANIRLKFGNYGKAIDTAVSRIQTMIDNGEIEKIYTTPALSLDVLNKLKEINTVEARYAITTNKIYTANVESQSLGAIIANIKLAIKAINEGKHINEGIRLTFGSLGKFGAVGPDTQILAVSGQYKLEVTELGMFKLDLELQDKHLNSDLNVKTLVGEIFNASKKLKLTINNSKKDFEAISKLVDLVNESVKKMDKNYRFKESSVATEILKPIDRAKALKSVASTGVCFLIDAYINAFKNFLKISNAVINAKAEDKK